MASEPRVSAVAVSIMFLTLMAPMLSGSLIDDIDYLLIVLSGSELGIEIGLFFVNSVNIFSKG